MVELLCQAQKLIPSAGWHRRRLRTSLRWVWNKSKALQVLRISKYWQELSRAANCCESNCIRSDKMTKRWNYKTQEGICSMGRLQGRLTSSPDSDLSLTSGMYDTEQPCTPSQCKTSPRDRCSPAGMEKSPLHPPTYPCWTIPTVDKALCTPCLVQIYGLCALEGSEMLEANGNQPPTPPRCCRASLKEMSST